MALRIFAAIFLVFAIVATAKSAPQTPDTIVINGDIYTVDGSIPRAEALAISNGRFSAVGSNAQIQRMANADSHWATCSP